MLLRLNVKADGKWKNAVLAYNPIVGCLISSRFLFKQDPAGQTVQKSDWLTGLCTVWSGKDVLLMLDH